jgi:hypothetical protein
LLLHLGRVVGQAAAQHLQADLGGGHLGLHTGVGLGRCARLRAQRAGSEAAALQDQLGLGEAIACFGELSLEEDPTLLRFGQGQARGQPPQFVDVTTRHRRRPRRVLVVDFDRDQAVLLAHRHVDPAVKLAPRVDQVVLVVDLHQLELGDQAVGDGGALQQRQVLVPRGAQRGGRPGGVAQCAQ